MDKPFSKAKDGKEDVHGVIRRAVPRALSILKEWYKEPLLEGRMSNDYQLIGEYRRLGDLLCFLRLMKREVSSLWGEEEREKLFGEIKSLEAALLMRRVDASLELLENALRIPGDPNVVGSFVGLLNKIAENGNGEINWKTLVEKHTASMEEMAALVADKLNRVESVEPMAEEKKMEWEEEFMQTLFKLLVTKTALDELKKRMGWEAYSA